MALDYDHLRQTLAQLHEQIEAADQLDPAAEAQLRAALDDIRHVLDRQTPLAEEETTLADRISEAESQFSATHPTLAGTLQRLVDLLAQMGI